MLVHRRVTPSIKFAGTHLYTWVERDTVRVKCLAQDLNTVFPARAQTRIARSGDERTNHEATAPSASHKEKNMLGKGRGSLKIIAIKCIDGIDSSTKNSTTVPYVPGEYGSAQTASTQNHVTNCLVTTTVNSHYQPCRIDKQL